MRRYSVKKKKTLAPSYSFVISLFILACLFRIFLMILQDIKIFRFFDTFTTLSVFLGYLEGTVSGILVLLLSTTGGLIEDILSGGILGLNMLTKSTTTFLIIVIRRKMEIGNPISLIPFVILFTVFDVIFKYFYSNTILGLGIATQILIAELFMKCIANIIILFIIMVIAKQGG